MFMNEYRFVLLLYLFYSTGVPFQMDIFDFVTQFFFFFFVGCYKLEPAHGVTHVEWLGLSSSVWLIKILSLLSWEALGLSLGQEWLI